VQEDRRVHEFLRGVADLGRGFRLWGSSPRLMLLGAVPALIVGAIWVGLLVALVTSLDGIAAWATGFADGWDEPFRSTVRVAAGLAILVLAVVIGALSFTAVVLTVGDPFYERISRRVEQRLGDAPEERDEPVLRGLLRAARDGLALLLASVGVGLVSFLLGLVPLVGPVIGGASATGGGAWAASALALWASASRPGCCS
jgi:CysZ protein